MPPSSDQPGRRTASRGPWRPPAKATRQVHSRRMLAAIAVALVISGLCVWVFAKYASKNTETVRLGDPEFRVGQASRLAKQVAANGPIFFPDLVLEDRLTRPVWLSHVGGADWAALNAIPPGAPSSCAVRADVQVKVFVDRCSGTTYNLAGVADNGQMLDRYRSEVDAKGVLTVDLNTPYPPSLR